MRVDRYDWPGGCEAMLRFGPAEGPVVIVAPPLFEEANRTRALLVAILRDLAARGIAGALPDLPGQGESITAVADVTLADWRAAFAGAATAAGRRSYLLAIRGGAMVASTADVKARLHLNPASGRTLVRDLLRVRRAASLATGEPLTADDPGQPGPPLLLAGNLVGRPLLNGLMAAEPAPADRVLRLFPSAEPAHRLLAPTGPLNAGGDLPRFLSPWRTAEAFADPDLAAMVAQDVAEWVASCEG